MHRAFAIAFLLEGAIIPGNIRASRRVTVTPIRLLTARLEGTMKFLKTLLLTTAAAMAFATTTQAASVTWNFTGNWLTTDYGPHGTGLAGSVTFDTVAGTATASPSRLPVIRETCFTPWGVQGP